MSKPPEKLSPELEVAAQNLDTALTAAEKNRVEDDVVWIALHEANDQFSRVLQETYGEQWEDIDAFDELAGRFIVQRNRYQMALGVPISPPSKQRQKKTAPKKSEKAA